MSIIKRLTALRALMKQYDVAACIVPGTDPHASEYMASHWTEMSWITGFLGETGTAVVTMEQALLWTDSRYYLQAEAELQGTTVELMRESDIDCPSIPEWLCKDIGNRVSGIECRRRIYRKGCRLRSFTNAHTRDRRPKPPYIRLRW